jgi:hypothetical protein
MLDVGRNRERSSVHEARIEVAIDDGNNLRDSCLALTDAVEDRLLAHAAVKDVGLHEALGLQDAAAVARKICFVSTIEQLLERGHEVGHAAFGRRHNARVPAHHMIAGEQYGRAF